MFDVKIKVKIDLKPLEKYVKILTTSGQAGFDEVMVRWIVRYKKHALAQYRRNSGGGGDWPPLKPPIRKRERKRSRMILRDSDTMIGMLEPVPTLDRSPRPGIQTLRRAKGVSIGFGGGRHPYSKLSLGNLASVHHLGRGRVPVRTILIDPTEEMKKGMAADVRNVANRIKREQGLS